MRNPKSTTENAAGLTAAEHLQRKRTLAIVLWITLGAAVVLGVVNLLIGAMPEAIVLFAAAVLCVPTQILNQRGRYLLASAIATCLILTAIVFNMYQGQGIHDSAMVAVPLFVMFGPLLYGRRAVPYFLAMGMAAMLGISSLELSGLINKAMRATAADVAALSVLVLCSGTLMWVVMSNLEGNLDRARQSEAQLRAAYDHTLEGWARALEFRDRGTEGHSRRVVNLCMRLAREWGFTPEEMSDIRRGALLHDIGKMAIPDEILLKRGRLTDREREIMKRHTIVARELLADIPYLRPALSIPVAHHEHWDGSGYPRGLRGTRIPLHARIFSVVDHYDALSSPRPYRRAWPRERVIAHIRANAGRVFDPEVTAVFLRLYQEKAFGKDA